MAKLRVPGFLVRYLRRFVADFTWLVVGSLALVGLFYIFVLR